MSNKRLLQVACTNVRSVCNKTSVLAEYVVESNLDILFLTETWLRPGEIDDHVIGDL